MRRLKRTVVLFALVFAAAQVVRPDDARLSAQHIATICAASRQADAPRVAEAQP